MIGMNYQETLENAIRYFCNLIAFPHKPIEKPEESIENRHIRNMMESREGTAGDTLTEAIKGEIRAYKNVGIVLRDPLPEEMQTESVGCLIAKDIESYRKGPKTTLVVKDDLITKYATEEASR